MNTEALAIALREITETKNLLNSLLISSESFDYPRAKVVLKALNQKVRDLSKLEQKLQKEQRGIESGIPNLCIVDFTHPRVNP